MDTGRGLKERIRENLLIGGYHNPPGLGCNPVEARRLLAEAGFPGGEGFRAVEYLFDTSSRLQEQIAVELQAMWRHELGVTVSLRKLEWKTFLSTQGKLDYDLCRSSWIGDYNDPNTFLDMFMSHNGNNRTGWKSARYDALLREANAQVDRGRRERLLQEAETLLVRIETPTVPLYFFTGLNIYDPDRLGSASLLAQEAIGWARRAGYRAILLATLPAMRAARTVYELLGFRPCAPLLAEPTPGADCFSLHL